MPPRFTSQHADLGPRTVAVAGPDGCRTDAPGGGQDAAGKDGVGRRAGSARRATPSVRGGAQLALSPRGSAQSTDFIHCGTGMAKLVALRLAIPATNVLPGLRIVPAMGEVKAFDASDACDEIS